MTDAGLFSTVPCLVSTVSRVGEVAPKSRTVSCSSVNLASANNTCLSASCTRGCLCRSLEYAYFITDDFPCPFPYLMQHPGRLGLLDCLEMHHAAPPVSTLGAVRHCLYTSEQDTSKHVVICSLKASKPVEANRTDKSRLFIACVVTTLFKWCLPLTPNALH
ncbi:hypothetical protein HRR86_004980 [Exophiala dermatitidis]|nr:hypothetical protein HRR82_005871 [Exophiala dermatitidis]KAJ4617843.1 hypothetical protein HRR85_002830 [Exophiala dermatitidis]KAJ4625503.1 hypothetical protein HRR86_004980 [Exophiala dermatitidis]